MFFIKKLTVTVILICSVSGMTPAQSYEPRPGIPEPSFGIDEPRPGHPPEWPAAERLGFYYVDITHPNATGSNNDFGYPDRPRSSLPTGIGILPAVPMSRSTVTRIPNQETGGESIQTVLHKIRHGLLETRRRCRYSVSNSYRKTRHIS